MRKQNIKKHNHQNKKVKTLKNFSNIFYKESYIKLKVTEMNIINNYFKKAKNSKFLIIKKGINFIFDFKS